MGTRKNKNGNYKTKYKNEGFVAVEIGGKLFTQISALMRSFDEVRYVKRIKPEKPISDKDFSFFVTMKNGKIFELRFGKSKSGGFEGYYFKHPKFNKGVYTALIGGERIERVKLFLKLNFTRTKEQKQPILRETSRNYILAKTPTKCWKCEGSGYIPKYKNIESGKCFACNGTGQLQKGRKYDSEIRIIYPELAESIQLKLGLENL